mgnify:CR=1 FL=1
MIDKKQIIMNFASPPGLEDLEALAGQLLETCPEELLEYCDELAIRVEEMPDSAIEIELELEDPFELLALYKSGSEIAPGVTSKVANDDDVLVLYRRPILDLWCESYDDLTGVVREAMIAELGRHFDFSDDEIEEFSSRHYQGLL